ncbi:MAG: hypothetical protein Q8S22_01925 [Eubacteriales bacterium]|nr:hypothetical protein [Eubacteriales bacterium]
MRMFSEIELREAARAIESTQMKSEKAILKLKDGSPQRRLTAQGIAAYALARALIARELGEVPEQTAFAREALAQAHEAFAFAAERDNSILPKFSAGTPQHTLAVRRIRAFEIAQALILREAAAKSEKSDLLEHKS